MADVRPFYKSPEPEPEPKRSSAMFGMDIRLGDDLQDTVRQLVEAMHANNQVVSELMQRPPYVVVQPFNARKERRTPVRDTDPNSPTFMRILHVDVEYPEE